MSDYMGCGDSVSPECLLDHIVEAIAAIIIVLAFQIWKTFLKTTTLTIEK